jgi:hypothetical protein
LSEVKRRRDACTLSVNSAGGVYEYQTDLATSFAAASECAGVKLTEFDGGDTAEELAGSISRISRSVVTNSWFLTIDYEPGGAVQYWMLTRPAHQTFTGRASKDEIAKRACRIARGRGAAVEN